MYLERTPHLFRSVENNLKYLDGATVSIDIDAVVQATFIKALNKVSHALKTVVLKEQLTSYWELVKISEFYGVPKDKTLEFAKSAYNDDGVYSESPAISGAETLLGILKELEYPHIFISSRPPEFLDTTRGWFLIKFPWVDPNNVILGRRDKMSGGEFKTSVINVRNVGLHIEDAAEEALEIAKRTQAKVLVVPQPWNLNEVVGNPRIKFLGPYNGDHSGVWPVLRFLMSDEARLFLQKEKRRSVAQY